jgi:hypothetical protein
MNRRSVLAGVGTVVIGGVAGCSSPLSDRPPAGTLRFVNDHNLPHLVSMQVIGVGSSPGEGPGQVEGDPIVPPAQTELSASAVVEPGETQTYEGVFTEAVWYAVRFTVDGARLEDDTGVVSWSPAPSEDGQGSFLTGRVWESGEFSWSVSSTEDLGLFDQ